MDETTPRIHELNVQVHLEFQLLKNSPFLEFGA